METFTLSRKELHRPGLLKGLCSGRLTNAQVAASLLNLAGKYRVLGAWEQARGRGLIDPAAERDESS